MGIRALSRSLQSAVSAASAKPHWLQELLGRVSSQVFFDRYFGREWFHREAQSEPSLLGNLVSLRELELFLMNREGQEKVVRVVGGRATQPDLKDRGDTDCSAGEALDAWAEGKTLVFNGIDRQLPAVHALARGLRGELKCRVGCNLYLTPAYGRGFESHYDSHDVFILQLFGSKRWRIGARAVDAPMPFQIHERITIDDGAQYTQITMLPGDVLYLPRGQAHAAVTEEDLSGHLTIAFYPKTYLDLILTAATIAADHDSRFREYLPPSGFLIGSDTVVKVRTLMASVSDECFAEAGEAFCELLVSERYRSPIDLLGLQGKFGALSERDRFRATPYLMASVSHGKGTLDLNAMGKSISLPPDAIEDVLLCCSGRVFTLSDLRRQSSHDERAKFVRRLLSEGIVQRLQPDDDLSDVPVDLLRHSA